MKILEGQIPHEQIWRALVLLDPGQDPGFIWQFGREVAHANGGEVLAVVIVPSAPDEHMLTVARRTLAEAAGRVTAAETVHTALIGAEDHRQTVASIIQKANIDLLLSEVRPNLPPMEYIPCAVGVLRGGTYSQLNAANNGEAVEVGQELPVPVAGAIDVADPAGATTANHDTPPSPYALGQIGHILAPTSAGPNSAHALTFALPLTPQTRLTALYVVPSHMGANEEALGRARLQQLAKFIDAGDRLDRKLIHADSVTKGIIDEACGPYDLVMIGASRESPFDRALFGDVVGSVVRESQTPVLVVREPNNRFGEVARGVAWRLQGFLPRLQQAERTQVYVRVRRSARPDADFFILITLSAMIAALGLLLNSGAVVIGAMLVAPLMSPMVGVGMATVLGDTRFLRLSLGAVLRGMLLAIAVGALSGLLRLNEPLTAELLARTQPNLLDLGVALFAGLAGAYALTNSDAAAALPGVAISAALVPPLATAGIALSTGHFTESLGALLLFTANFVAIVFASVLVFLTRGFRPTPAQKARQAVRLRTVRVAMVMLVVVTVLLSAFTFRLTQQAALINRIQNVAGATLTEVTGADLVDLQIMNLNDNSLPLELDIVAQSTRTIPFNQVKDLQNAIAVELQPDLAPGREVQLVLTVILVTRLDPVVPPTATPTPTSTETPTPGPTPTVTDTPTPTNAPTNTATAVVETETPAVTETLPPTETPLPTETPTPAPPQAVVLSPYGLNLRAEPSQAAQVLAVIPEGAVVLLLPDRETINNTIWQQVEYEGQVGWVLADLLSPVTP